MRRHFVAMTAGRAARMGLNPSRPYGYVVQIVPPVVTVKTGEDIEGIGWHPMPPTEQVQNFAGWHKYRADAVRRAEELNAAEARGEGHYRQYERIRGQALT